MVVRRAAASLLLIALPLAGQAAELYRYLDRNGQIKEEWLEGHLATIAQHEIDHLNGILFIDHISRLKRGMLLKKLDKLRRG